MNKLEDEAILLIFRSNSSLLSIDSVDVNVPLKDPRMEEVFRRRTERVFSACTLNFLEIPTVLPFVSSEGISIVAVLASFRGGKSPSIPSLTRLLINTMQKEISFWLLKSHSHEFHYCQKFTEAMMMEFLFSILILPRFISFANKHHSFSFKIRFTRECNGCGNVSTKEEVFV